MPAMGQNGGKTSSIELDAGDLAEVIRKTIFAVSLDDTRSNLAGVYLEKGTKKGQVRLVATDGHRLAMVDRKVKGQGPDKGVILPKKGLAELAKLLPDETGNVTLTIGGNTVTADLGGRLFNMRLVEGNFPDYHQVVPKETLKIITAERDELLQTMRRVSILSSERARGIKLSLKEGALEIVANNPDLGEAREDIGIEYDGGEFEIGFNARYMVEVLGVLPEGSKIEIGLSDELSPGVIRGEDRDYSYVVMPMRI
jgi:DNA polymerase-3 subunit beta